MPEITNENEESKKKKKSVAKKSTKSSGKSTTKKNNSKVSSNKNTTKSNSKKNNNSKKVTSTASTTKTSKTPKTDIKSKPVKKKKDEVIKEETVIEKIKSFLSKIIAMQEEDRKEEVKKTQIEEDKNSTKINKQKDIPHMLEYYDLPYRYNETIVKILAQTPKKLFVYWDISDYDRQKFLKAFGEKFFEETYPVLLVHNEEKNYTFEVAINDFANSWYLDINDAKSKYIIELGRKFRTKPEIVNIATTDETKDVILKNDYVPITVSNTLEVPNDHILFENVQEKVLFRNVKDNKEIFVDIKNNAFTNNMKHIYSVYDLYKEVYKDEIKDENMLNLLNPSSMSSSTFK